MDPLGIVNAVAPIVGKVIDRIPDPAARERASQEIDAALLKLAMEQSAAQSDINRIEAQSGSLLQAGWRPSVGWVCVAGLALNVVIAPLGVWTAGLFGKVVPMPPISTELVLSLLFPLLGLGAYRTFEKIKRVA